MQSNSQKETYTQRFSPSSPIAINQGSVTVCKVPTNPPEKPSKSELLLGLNDEQAQAVSHRGSPLLVMAGPGSGKTKVLTHRLASFVADGTPLSKILAVTFTNKAAKEMRDRVEMLLGFYDDSNETQQTAASSVCTFHSFCARTLRANADSAGLPRGFSIVDASDSVRIMSTASGLDDKDSRAVLSSISFAKNSMTDISEYESSFSPHEKKIFEAWSAYQEKLKEMGALDFDDLLLKTRLLLLGPHGPSIAARYDVLLVDEWQDTNMVQYDIVRLLASKRPTPTNSQGVQPTTSSHNTPVAHIVDFRTHGFKEVCVVGDFEQAIYGWRGASSDVMDLYVEEFSPKVVELGLNYRSTPEIVALSATVAESSLSSSKVSLRTNNKPGEKVRLFVCDDSDDEAQRIVADLRVKSGTKAVLVRTKAQTRAFEAALLRAGIKYQLIGAQRFSDRQEVKDVLAYLRIFLNPADELSFRRAATVPRRKIGESSMEIFLKAAKEANLPPGLALQDPVFISGLPTRVRKGFELFATDFKTISEASVNGVSSMIDTILNQGLRLFYHSDQERVENLQELQAAASAFEVSHKNSYKDATNQEVLEFYVENMSLASAADASEDNEVSVITAHASKGREFNHVWVVGLEQDTFPHILADSQEEHEEERRLFFVAVSRPRFSLTLSYRNRVFRQGSWEDADPSEFLDVVREHLSYNTSSSKSIYSGGSYNQKNYKKNSYNKSYNKSYKKKSSQSFLYPSSLKPASPGDSTSTTPAVRKDLLDPSLAVPGALVSHTVFGDGIIKALAGSIVSVDFSGQVRQLDLAHAPMSLRA